MRKKRQDPEEKLEKHAEELDELRDFVDTTTFSGDEREMTGEVSTVDQHPGDGADFTFQRELMETTRQIIDQEAQQVQDAIERRAFVQIVGDRPGPVRGRPGSAVVRLRK